MVGLDLSRTMAFVGKTVKEAAEIFPEIHFVPIAIQRYGTQYTIIPRGDTQLKEGDHIVFITSEGGAEELCKITGKINTEIKNVMILGGSKIGYKTARDLANSNFNVKLIEKDKERAFDLADELPNVLVINGDGRNVVLLDGENIGDMDAFISVTGDNETNIMSSLLAKNMMQQKAAGHDGANDRTIALVNKLDYQVLAATLGLDIALNKKSMAANVIMKYIRRSELLSVAHLHGFDAG